MNILPGPGATYHQLFSTYTTLDFIGWELGSRLDSQQKRLSIHGIEFSRLQVLGSFSRVIVRQFNGRAKISVASISESRRPTFERERNCSIFVEGAFDPLIRK
jgi:hypothetical protein